MDQKFYPSESEKSDSEEDEDKNSKSKTFSMDPDHRLLLRSCQPLLLSRNSAVGFNLKTCFFKYSLVFDKRKIFYLVICHHLQVLYLIICYHLI